MFVHSYDNTQHSYCNTQKVRPFSISGQSDTRDIPSTGSQYIRVFAIYLFLLDWIGLEKERVTYDLREPKAA